MDAFLLCLLLTLNKILSCLDLLIMIGCIMNCIPNKFFLSCFQFGYFIIAVEMKLKHQVRLVRGQMQFIHSYCCYETVKSNSIVKYNFLGIIKPLTVMYKNMYQQKSKWWLERCFSRQKCWLFLLYRTPVYSQQPQWMVLLSFLSSLSESRSDTLFQPLQTTTPK